MAKEFLIPKKDILVPKPAGGYLAPGGETIEMDIYWQRIVNDGDASVGNPPKTKGDSAA